MEGAYGVTVCRNPVLLGQHADGECQELRLGQWGLQYSFRSQILFLSFMVFMSLGVYLY
jgi:hypothetical protein